MSAKQKRAAGRKTTQHIHVSELTNLSNYSVIANEGTIIDASASGFCLMIDRTSLVPRNLKATLSLDAIIGQQVVMFLPSMNLDLDGTIRRTQHRGKGLFEVAIEFSPDVPEYWRECLVDLLPAPGEIESAE
jgi:hypothetical protein